MSGIHNRIGLQQKCLSNLLIMEGIYMVKVNTKNKTILGCALLIFGLINQVQSGALYSIEKYTIDGGGSVSSGGLYTVSGTIGQSDAGVVLSAGSYSVRGGFWAASNGSLSDLIFINGFE